MAAATPSEFAAACPVALVQAASGGETATVAWLIDVGGVDVSVLEDLALYEAAYHGHAVRVEGSIVCMHAASAILMHICQIPLCLLMFEDMARWPHIFHPTVCLIIHAQSIMVL